MKKIKPVRKAAPPVTGLMACSKQHEWNVVDLNVERQAVNCPVCGRYTSIAQGLINVPGRG